MNERVYLDWNATAPLRPEARAAMHEALGLTGNASSVHAEGRAARHLVEKARRQVAALVGAAPQDVTFTSGATEANMLALHALVGGTQPRGRLFVSAVEHPSVRSGGRFAPENVEILPVNGDGLVEPAGLAAILTGVERPLVSVMLANNETGVVQPIRAIADVVHAANGLLHVDAVQGAGRIDCDLNTLQADLMSLSAHKLGGPQGAGALVRRDGVHMVEPLIKGGGQERSLRAGTENVPAIAGFGAAAVAAGAAREIEAFRMAALRDRLESGIRATTPQAVIFGAQAERLPNTTLFSAFGLKAETAIIAFDLNGIAVSSGAACSSGKVQASTVLLAMGVEPALARGAVRVSLGWSTTETDLERFLGTWIRLSASLLKESTGLAA
jgi:cysteine desulfurase